jgi:hypothetical protein
MEPARLLRLNYRVNAAATLACGVILLAGGHVLAEPFGQPREPLWGLGVFFAAFATWIWMISRRTVLSWKEAFVAGAVDGAYAIASFGFVATGGSQLTMLLKIGVLLVAAPVTLFAAVELYSAARLRSA